MTIEDFRKKTRELLWTNGIKEAFEDELNLMLDRLFQLFQKFYQGNKVFASGEECEVHVCISNVQFVPADFGTYSLSLNKLESDKGNAFGSVGDNNFEFKNDLFHKQVWPQEYSFSSGNYQNIEKFQLYQELWLTSYLPTIFKANNIRYDIEYEDEEVLFITFYPVPEWFLF